MCQLATPTDGRHRLARPRRSVAVGQSHLGRKPLWLAGSFVATRRRWPARVCPARWSRPLGAVVAGTGPAPVAPLSTPVALEVARRQGDTAILLLSVGVGEAGIGYRTDETSGSRPSRKPGRQTRPLLLAEAKQSPRPAFGEERVRRLCGPRALPLCQRGNPGGSRTVADVCFLERALGRRPVCDDRPRDGGVSVATGRA